MKVNNREVEVEFTRDLKDRIEWQVEKIVIEKVRKRQSCIPGLMTNGYTAVLGGKLLQSCLYCLEGEWTQIRSSSECQLDCNFCYWHSLPKKYLPKQLFVVNDNQFTEQDIKTLLEIQGDKVKGVAWLHYEPLLYLDKILGLIKFISTKKYQWLYTNGILATEENLKQLERAGLNEIRFNLAATNCDDKVIENIKLATKYFRSVCIESPMFSNFFKSFMSKKEKILNTGISHIHFAELQLFPYTIKLFKDEGPIYRYHKGYVSPVNSRQMIYDVFDIATKEKWPVVLHDCSNEVKFFRGIASVKYSQFGTITYRNSEDKWKPFPERFVKELPTEFYKDAVCRYNIFGEEQ